MIYLAVTLYCGALACLLTTLFLFLRGCTRREDFYWRDKHGAVYSLSYTTFAFVYTIGGAFSGLALYALFMPLINLRFFS